MHFNFSNVGDYDIEMVWNYIVDKEKNKHKHIPKLV